MDPTPRVSNKPSQYVSLGKGEYFDRKANQIVVFKDGKYTPTGKTPVYEKDQAGNKVVKGNNGGYVGIQDGRTYKISGNLMSAQNEFNFVETPDKPLETQFLRPDPKTGVIDYFGLPQQPAVPTQPPTPTAKTGKAGITKPAATKPVTPPVAAKPTNAQLLAGLPIQDPNDASFGAYSDPNAFKNTTVGPLNSGLKPAVPNADPKKSAVAANPNAVVGATGNGMNWQSYLGLGTDLLAGGMAMAMANKPMTPFKQPQAYDTMMQEVTQRRNEGLPFDQRAMANQRIQNQYSTDMGSVSKIANGSAGLYMSGIQGASANAQSSNLAMSALDQQIRQQNQGTFNNAAVQDMNREQAAYAQLHQEEMNARNSYAQAGAANFQQAGARMDYINQYENPNSFYNLLQQNMKEQIGSWGSYLRQPIQV